MVAGVMTSRCIEVGGAEGEAVVNYGMRGPLPDYDYLKPPCRCLRSRRCPEVLPQEKPRFHVRSSRVGRPAPSVPRARGSLPVFSSVHVPRYRHLRSGHIHLGRAHVDYIYRGLASDPAGALPAEVYLASSRMTCLSLWIDMGILFLPLWGSVGWWSERTTPERTYRSGPFRACSLQTARNYG